MNSEIEKNGFYGLRGTKNAIYRRSNKDPEEAWKVNRKERAEFDGWKFDWPCFVRQCSSYVLTQDMCSMSQ